MSKERKRRHSAPDLRTNKRCPSASDLEATARSAQIELLERDSRFPTSSDESQRDQPISQRASVRSKGRRTSTPSTGSEEPERLNSAGVAAELHGTNRALRWSRGALILTIVAAASVVGTLTYMYASHAEHSNLYETYNGAVGKIASGFQDGVNRKVWSAQTFSAVYTSRYGGTTAHWPNATMPNFQEQVAAQLLLADGRAISFNPIIRNSTRLGWEAHAIENAELIGSDALIHRTSNSSRIIADGIFQKINGTAVNDTGWASGSRYPDVLVPVWQIAPIVTNEKAVMFDLHSETNRQRALDDLITYRVPTLTAILQLVQDTELRPSAILFYPVIRAFESDLNGTMDPDKSHGVADIDIVATISVVFSWDDVLSQLLPHSLSGIVCVLESSLDQQFTYLVQGEQVVLLGAGDLHDTGYDHMKVAIDANLGDVNSTLGIVDNLITYRLFIYPSSAFVSRYVDKRPTYYTLGAVMIFFCTAALFLIYDYLVDSRQRTLSSIAKKTSQIVDALFPPTFRDRLFERNATEKNARDNHPMEAARSHQRIQISVGAKSMLAFIKGTRDNVDYDVGAHIGSKHAEKPIAELFQDTSIMFCDVVGFTAWSANHEPDKVFLLLETLFWEFDQLAAEFAVFKLGTIGDCWIGCTGLPEPRQNHASLLAEFTLECKEKVKEVRLALAETGLDTSGLTMRFGIHSGPVTAGILRGQKSRFELFGDTINTASRMESTSKPGCIQVSAATAELLRESGMGSWLAPRNGLVEAKGKGQMATFWLILPDEEDDVPSSDGATVVSCDIP